MEKTTNGLIYKLNNPDKKIIIPKSHLYITSDLNP